MSPSSIVNIQTGNMQDNNAHDRVEPSALYRTLSAYDFKYRMAQFDGKQDLFGDRATYELKAKNENYPVKNQDYLSAMHLKELVAENCDHNSVLQSRLVYEGKHFQHVSICCNHCAIFVLMHLAELWISLGDGHRAIHFGAALGMEQECGQAS